MTHSNDNRNSQVHPIFQKLLNALTMPPQFDPDRSYTIDEVLNASGFTNTGTAAGTPVYEPKD